MSAPHPNQPAATPERRAFALRDALVDRGLIEAGEAEALAHRALEELSPDNGARVVARAWVDPDFRERLLSNATAAAKELGIDGPEGRQMVAVENTATTHNVIVCTQCSCTAWPLLGLPPDWYKAPPYRARVVREARTLLAEMGLQLPDATDIRVWDTSGETRYFVLPMRPEGTEHLTEEQLARLVTRDALIGVARIQHSSAL
ncbi:nitrile hydratase subunit alpha [Bradyrhizobium sp. DASA03120]|uniref:nitrile hydratase subunit alpha n=1 Tax=Bradyrhizobium sp. SMVTL-02 TaxID=3395917 RepID=UPI003F6F846E